ncbi:restriction endonuclease subunit S [Streptomyces axinellae]|uniref:Restriction endonuclease subunit S n=1 Tax=Streptomyces axinellae TaxID=552788 RepID=A0ABN3QS49_9ACTN
MRSEADVTWVPVGNLGQVRMGKQLSPAGRTSGEQFPYLRVANVFDGHIDYSDVKTMGFTEAERKTYALHPGDILLNEGQSLELVGRSSIYNGSSGEFCFQNTLVRFRPGDGVLPGYVQEVFSHWLATGVFAQIAKKTTSIAHLGGDRFAALPFPVLPLPEQRRIIEVLDSVADSERAIEASIAKLRVIQHARLAQATEPTSAVEVSPLKTRLLRIDAGRSPDLPNTPAAPGEWGVLKVSAIHRDGFRPSENKVIDVVTELDEKHEVRPGDLLMSRANTPELVGSSCIAADSSTRLLLSDKTLRLVENPRRANRAYINLCLASEFVRRQIQNLASGSSRSMQNISQKAIESMSIPWPHLAQQQRVVAEFNSTSDQILYAKAELAKLRTLKTGLADDLLSGKVRVGEVA